MTLKQAIAQAIGENLTRTEDDVLSAVMKEVENRQSPVSSGKVKQFKGGNRMKTAKTWSRKILAACVAAALLVTATVVGYAVASSTAAATLTATENAITGGDVNLEVSVTKTAYNKGIVGLTLDIVYDTDKLSYDSDVDPINPAANMDNFDVSAHQWTDAEDGGRVKIRVLVFAKEMDTDDKLYSAPNAAIFSLPFTATAIGTATFTAENLQFADYDDAGTGFQLMSVNSPVSDSTVIAAPAKTATLVATKSQLNGTVLTAGADDKITASQLPLDEDGEKLFLGWFTDSQKTIAFDPDAALSQNITLYSKFEDAPAQLEEVDSTDVFNSDLRPFGILGSQVRQSDSGLRFMARISDDLADSLGGYQQIEFGILLVSKNFFGNEAIGSPSELVRGWANETLAGPVSKSYVTVVKAQNIFNEFEGYKRYTAVITGLTSSAQRSTPFSARAYITYTDENGNLRTIYATESDNEDGTGNYKTGGGAYWKSWNQANADLGRDTANTVAQ
ncbi:MAG: hypothetical protein LBQ48_06750 [Oscillospiraceae bacterium]|jgi:hypothetical protein|nr:hypothetical protein [Oscillospiraceae bacterium]